MATPSRKAPAIENLLNNLNMGSGIDRTIAIHNNICTSCGGIALEFSDDLSEREYEISGFCQECQDKIFGGEE